MSSASDQGPFGEPLTGPFGEILTKGDRAILARLADKASEELGIRLPETKVTMLHSRVRRRMRSVGVASLSAYEQLLNSAAGAAEHVHFLDSVTTNKTHFFREPYHFEVLLKEVLPPMFEARARGGRWQARIWCAGCSTGEEAYSLCMTLSEYARVRPGFSFSVTATDVSTRVLAHAAAAIYTDEQAEEIPVELRQRYMMRSKDRAANVQRVVPELRKLLKFERLNFMEESYALEGPFDVIFFRNVLIYFDPPTQAAVLRRQCQLLRPAGFLFIGHSESIYGLDVPLESLGNSVLRRRHG
ncbi:MAG TPA: CheR family methyltransferase [Polyangiales bacterium]